MDYQNTNVSDNDFEKCTKCTVCTVYCPVSAVNPSYPGPKQAGPDGERFRLKKPRFFSEALKYCLNCKRCEVACPSNVKVGDIIQSARIAYTKQPPSLRDRMLASTDALGAVATKAAPIVNAVLSAAPVKAVMGIVAGIAPARTMPRYASQKFTSWYRRNALARQEAMPRKVSFFHGCYVNYNNPQLGRDLIDVLNAAGIGVMLLDEERCCGIAKISNRLVGSARRDAMLNLRSIRTAVERYGSPVITTGSTCTLTMRDEYPHLLHLDNADVRDSIMLATKYIYTLADRGEIRLVWREDFHMKIAYHVPCHMQKLGWTYYSASLLRMIPGVELTVLDSDCCGMAGTYGFKKENYKYSQEIGRALFDRLDTLAPDLVATDCETCKWQIEMSTRFRAVHPVSVIARALDLEKTRKANS